MQHVIVAQTHNQVNKLKVKLPAQQKQYQQELFNPYTYTTVHLFISIVHRNSKHEWQRTGMIDEIPK